MSFFTWERSEKIPFPSIWSSFERVDKSGRKLYFKVQDLPDELKEECLGLMSEVYLKEEIVLSTLDILHDELSLKELQGVWLLALNHKLSLVCLSDEDPDFPKPKIAGINLTFYYHKGDLKDFPLQGTAMKAAKEIADYLDSFNSLDLGQYLSSLGLLILPQYRNLGLATEILKAREPLCKAAGIPVSLSRFSSLQAQKAAEKAGYETVLEKPYKELDEKFPPYVFDGGETKTLKICWRKFSFSSWQRDPFIPFPSIWKQFERKMENNTTKYFRIQDVTEELKDDFFKVMKEVVLVEEKIMSSLKIHEDEVSSLEIQAVWEKALEQKLSLVCLADNTPDFPSPQVAGVNLILSHKEEGESLYDINFSGVPMQAGQKLSKFLDDLKNSGGVPEGNVMKSLGLGVVPAFRGMGIATEILLAREPLAKAVGLKEAYTTFSSLTSQKCGRKAGYEVLCELSYGILSEKFPPYVFHGGETLSLELTKKIFD